MQRLPLLAFLLTLLSPLSGQEPADLRFRNQLTLTVGLNQGYLKDLNYSPLHYRAGGLHLGLAYERTTANGDRWQAGFGLGLLSNKVKDNKWAQTDRYLIDFSLGYRKGLGEPTADRRLFVGGNYRSYVDISLFDGTEATTFFGLHGFELAGDYHIKTGNRQRWRAGLALPVVGSLVRPPYTGWDKFIVDNADNIPKILARGKWTSLNEFFGLRGSLAYSYHASDRWTFAAEYALAYYATRQLDPFRSLNNQLTLKTTLNY